MSSLTLGQDVAPEWPLELREFSEDYYGGYEKFKTVCDKWGYKFKAFNVYTSDGWFLTVFRITGSEDSIETIRHNNPILFQHGSGGDAATFLNWAKFDKPWLFSLYDAGYDIWMGNNRGTQYSRAKAGVGTESTQKELWDFTVEDMGRYDLPAEIDLVLNVTGKHKLTYIGNSRGTT